MITAIQQKFETVSFDLNHGLHSISTYAWIASGVLFVCYMYFVGAITFSVVKQRALAQETKQLISQTSVEEMNFLAVQKSLTQEFAQSTGLVSAGSTIAYTGPRKAFAWNVGQ